MFPESLMTRLVAFMLGPLEMIILGVVAVLLFGSRLPQVARSLGKSFVEFKRGIHGVEDEIRQAVYHEAETPSGNVENETSMPGSTPESSGLVEEGSFVKPPESTANTETDSLQ